jgi:hypothetical protein
LEQKTDDVIETTLTAGFAQIKMILFFTHGITSEIGFSATQEECKTL